MEVDFKKTLKRLNKKSIDSYLLHNQKDFLKENRHLLINWLKSLKDRGLIKRFGISIYQESELS